ncbi:4769_t:CDS:2, partial [Cetraspora pellucida]
KELEAEVVRLHEEKLRLLADNENQKKIHQRETERKESEAVVKTHSLAIKMIKNKVEKNLEAEGVKEIKIKVSEDRANSYYHEIVATEENSELASNTILEVIKKGYLLRDQVLKASQKTNGITTENEYGLV